MIWRAVGCLHEPTVGSLDFDTRRAIGTVLLGALAMTFVILPTGCWLHAHGVTSGTSVAVAPTAGP